MALRYVVGSKEVMTEQLHHLLSIGELGNVEIQVLPWQVGVHPGLNGPFVLLETQERRRYAYIESQDIGQVVGDTTIVSDLTLRYGKLRSLALNIEESTRLIEKLIGER